VPVILKTDVVVHLVHGSTFTSYVPASRDGAQLCAWQLTVPAGLRGAEHSPTREEVMLIVDGELRVTLDGVSASVHPGDVVLVPAGSQLRVDGGPAGATAWVTAAPGLEAVMSDGTRVIPPWAN